VDPDVKAYLEDAERAIDAYRTRAAEVRALCDHSQLLHAPYKPSASGLFPGLDQTRLCLRCGTEERSSAWTDGGGFKRLKGEFTKRVTHEEIWKARFPHIHLSDTLL